MLFELFEAGDAGLDQAQTIVPEIEEGAVRNCVPAHGVRRHASQDCFLDIRRELKDFQDASPAFHATRFMPALLTTLEVGAIEADIGVPIEYLVQTIERRLGRRIF